MVMMFRLEAFGLNNEKTYISMAFTPPSHLLKKFLTSSSSTTKGSSKTQMALVRNYYTRVSGLK